MDPAVFKANDRRGHRNGIPVGSHVFYLADAKELIGEGVDALATASAISLWTVSDCADEKARHVLCLDVHR